jgi:hypothetical protein
MQWVQLPSALVLTRKGLQLLESLENSENVHPFTGSDASCFCSVCSPFLLSPSYPESCLGNAGLH